MYKHITYDDAVNNRVYSDPVSKRIVVMLPAHDEENSIKDTLDSLSKLNVPDNFILDVFIALDNCTDNTDLVIKENSDNLNVYVLNTVNNHDRKVGALNQLYRLFFGDMSEDADKLSEEHLKTSNNILAFLGIDADVYLDKDCLVTLYSELNMNYKIGSVSANYSCLLPESARHILRNDPNAEKAIKGHSAFARFITVLQSKDFALWTIRQKVAGGRAEIAGGQCTLFRPDAIKEVFNTMKLNGIYDNSTATEDLKLTQDMRLLGWKTLISSQARCWVDSMKDYKSLLNQRIKWQQGKLDFMMSSTSRESLIMWGQEFLLFLNLIIRVLLLTLLPISIYTGMFTWNWIWIMPFIISSVLNVIITIKTPLHRLIDIIISMLGISSELWLWFEIRVHISVWIDKFKISRKDGWLLQEQAEKGLLKSNFSGILGISVIITSLLLLFYTKLINMDDIINLIKPYIISGFNFLTWITLITIILMIKQLLKLRGNYKA